MSAEEPTDAQLDAAWRAHVQSGDPSNPFAWAPERVWITYGGDLFPEDNGWIAKHVPGWPEYVRADVAERNATEPRLAALRCPIGLVWIDLCRRIAAAVRDGRAHKRVELVTLIRALEAEYPAETAAENARWQSRDRPSA
jgi:hypothetical protein